MIIKSSKTVGSLPTTPFALGNYALRTGQYAEAVTLYVEALQQSPALGKTIAANMAFARQKYRASREIARLTQKPRVAVCGWELAHNAAGRVYTLAMLYESFADVEIIGSLFPNFGHEVWQPIRNTAITKHTFIVEDENRFLEQAIQLVAVNPYDIVHLSKPRAVNIFFGVLYKIIWDAKVLIDIDDEELAFVDEETPLSIDDYLKQHDKLPELNNLAGKDWTRIAVGLVHEFDAITVSNAALQCRYGGEIVAHARNENEFKPSLTLRQQSRQALGILPEQKVVLFSGTPRPHKGLLEVAEAIQSLHREDILFVIVGSFDAANAEFNRQLQSMQGINYLFLENKSVTSLAATLAIADCSVLLQDTGHAWSQFQIPAKLSDALAMKIPVLTTATPALSEVIAAGAVVQITPQSLAQKIAETFDYTKSPDSSSLEASQRYFTEYISFAANRPKLQHALQLAEQNKNSLTPALQKIFAGFQVSKEILFPLFAISQFASSTVHSSPAVSITQHQNISNKTFLKYFTECPLPGVSSIDHTIKDHVVNNALQHELITFDIWDTVLRRDCHPDEIKLRAARVLWLLSGVAASSTSGITPRQLYQLRKDAEKDVGDEHYEYRVQDVFNRWLDLLGINKSHDAQLIHNQVLESELRAECASTRPDPTMLAVIANLKGKRKVAVSDFYHGQEGLSSILRYHHLDQHFDAFYVSCDWRKTKRVGTLFDVVLEKEKSTADSIFHVGDNPHADQAKALEKGFRTYLYLIDSEKIRQEWYQKGFEDYLDEKPETHWQRFMDIAGISASFDSSIDISKIEDLAQAGKLLAPIVVGFVLSCIEAALARGVTHIYFFSREGIFFKRVYDLLVDLDVYDLGKYPESKLLYVSRRATFAPALRKFDLDELMRMWNLYSTQTIDAFARSLNMDTVIVGEMAISCGVDPSRPIQYPWQHEQFKIFFNSEQFQSYASAHLAKQREGLLAHLDLINFKHNDPIQRVIVDIGWRGTIQDNLSELCSGSLHGIYLALKGFLNKQPGNTSKTGYLSDDNSGRTFELGDVAALEFILNGTGGSVIGYSENGEPIREIFDGEENIILNQVAQVQQGILDASKEMGRYIRRHGLVSNDLLGLVRRIVSNYINNPPLCIADAFTSLEHNETFGTGDSDDIAAQFSKLKLLSLIHI